MTRVFTLATLFALLFALFTQPFCPLATLQASEQSTSPLPLRVEQADGIVRIKIDDQPFAAIDFKSYAKPIVYPIYGPGQIPMTRNFPMKRGIPTISPCGLDTEMSTGSAFGTSKERS